MKLYFLVLFGFIFILLVNTVVSGDPLCPSSILPCYNCEVRGGCLQGEYSKITEEECLNHLKQQVTIWSVEYNYTSGGCRESNCEDIEIEYREGRVIHRKTCDTECGRYTLKMVPEHKVSTNQDSSWTETGLKDWECISHCLSRNAGCTVAYESYSEQCVLYTECQDGCSLTENMQTWRVYTKTCEDPGCGTPTRPGNGSLSINGTAIGEIAKFTCNDGFLISPDSKSNTITGVCKPDGTWSEVTPVCEIIDCGEPDAPKNGFVNFTGTKYQHKAYYSCKFAYMLSVDNAQSVCTSQGNWEEKAPKCEKVDCQKLEHPTNGRVNMTGSEYNDVATFTCNSGYSLVGNNSAICDRKGNWNIKLPTCEPISTAISSGPTLQQSSISQTKTSESSATTAFETTSTTSPAITSPTTTPKKMTPATTSPTTTSQTTPSLTSPPTPPSPTTTSPTSSPLTTTSPKSSSSTTTFPQTTSPQTTSSTRTPAATTKPLTKLYIMPCICYHNKTFANKTQEEIISQLIMDTEIDKKKTVLAQSRLKSRFDSRLSSAVIGTSGLVILCILAGIILCCDLVTVYVKRSRVSKTDSKIVQPQARC